MNAGFLIVLLAIVVLGISIGSISLGRAISKREIKSAGNKGERAAIDYLKRNMNEDDLLFSNIKISYDGKKAELDDLIVNENGVFIFEVKNYSGILYGEEDDKEWTKVHTTAAGNSYKKIVRNPIPQVKRQIYIFSHYLKENGIYVWVDGYAIFARGNCPVISEYVLRNSQEIDETIHSERNKKLDKKTITKIENLLYNNKE